MLADLFFDLAFAAAGFAATRLMLVPGEGAVRRLIETWAAAIRWGLPALVAVVVAVLAVSLVLLPPADLTSQAWTALWTALGSSGHELMKQGPFDPRQSSELLLHLWAVGATAQLFVGWTAVVAVIIGLRRTRWIGAVALAGVLLSLWLDWWMRGRGLQLAAFYLAPANAWPFLIGAFYASTSFVPDFQAMSRPRWLAQAGGLAWSFCLWVWPVAALPPMILARPLTPWEWMAAVTAAALLTLATRRWIERPLRRRLGYRPRTAFAALAVSVVAVCGFSLAILAANGLPGRAPARVLAEEADRLVRPPLQAACHVEMRARRPNPDCTTPPGGPAEVVVWGNSHAAHLTPAVLDWTGRRGLRMRQATKSGCLPLLASSEGLASDNCMAFNRAAVAEMAEGPPPRLIILGAAWTVVMARSPGDDAAESRALTGDLTATVRQVRAAVGPGTAIVLLGETPGFAFAPADCHDRRRFLGLDTRRCDLSPPANAGEAWAVDDMLDRIAMTEPGVQVFHPSAALCRAGRCRTRGPDGPWYADRHHLTPAGGRAQSDTLAAILDAATARR